MVYEYYRPARQRQLLSRHERWKKQAKVMNLSKTAQYFGIGYSTFQKWKKRFDDTNLYTLEEQSRTPKKTATRHSSPIKDERVIALRKKYPYFGKRKLSGIYKRMYNEVITQWYIQRVIEVYQLYFKKRKKQHHTKRPSSLAKKRVTELWNTKEPPEGFFIHLDTIVLYVNGIKRYIITGIEDKSKFAFARMYQRIQSSSAADFLKRMAYIMHEGDTTLTTVHTDNGAEFHKDFITATEEMDLEHYWNRPHIPKDNPSFPGATFILIHPRLMPN